MSFQIDPIEYFPLPTKFGTVGLGKLYLGTIDGNPANVPADRIQAYIVRQGLPNLAIPQPIDISAGGVPLYQGSPVQIEVLIGYSMQILDSGGSQIYYTPNAGKIGVAITTINAQIVDIYSQLALRVQTIATVAALRATQPSYVGQMFNLLGYTVAGKGGGIVYYVGTVANTSSDNGVTVFVSSVGGVFYEFRRPIGDILGEHGGVIADGVTDDTTAIQRVLAAATQYCTIKFTGKSIISATIIPTVDYVTIKGPALWTAKANVNFQYMFLATNRTGIVVDGINFDINSSNRLGVQAQGYFGFGFSICTDCKFLNCTGMNAWGFGGGSAVIFVMGGYGSNCIAQNCKAINGGSVANPADGFYTKGIQTLIDNCQASGCYDTAFVLEDSDFSGIKGCTAIECASVAAISLSTQDGTPRRGNYINGLTGRNWKGASGGLYVGVLGGGNGDLLDTEVNGVIMYADLSNYGVGPAINVGQNASAAPAWVTARLYSVGTKVLQGGITYNCLVMHTSGVFATDLASGYWVVGATAQAIGVTINGPRINGATAQGILVTGLDVQIVEPNIKNTQGNGIQFQNTTNKAAITGGWILGAPYGIYASGNTIAVVKGTVLNAQTTNAIYAADTSVVRVMPGISIIAPGVAPLGKDATATLAYTEVLLPYSASINIDATLGSKFRIVVTNTTAFTINNPTSATSSLGQELEIIIENNSGGAMGVITWGAGFGKSVWTNPANGFNRTWNGRWKGTTWNQTDMSNVDVPN